MRTNTVVVEVFDAAGLRGIEEGLSHGNAHRYRLREPKAAPPAPTLVSRYANRSAGDLHVSVVSERLGTAIGLVEPGVGAFCFLDLRAGAMSLTPAGTSEATTGRPGCGLIHGGEGGMKALTQDGTMRTNLWVERERMESALSNALEDALPGQLRFEPLVDWSAPGPGAIRRLLLHAEAEFAREDGMATQPLALAAFTDLVVQTALRDLRHNYTDRLQRPAGVAAPAHLRRAEAFMRAQAAAPIGLAEIAAAAGCSVRTLQNAFRLFRETTPHRALQAIRLERAREDLMRGDGTVATVARRYGFSHAGRFAATYARRFGATPRQR